MEKIDYVKQGKRNRINGSLFEKRVRDDLESNGWIVSRWMQNVELPHEEFRPINPDQSPSESKVFVPGKCVPSKPSRFRLSSTGFPDFIAYECAKDWNDELKPFYDVIFVECKVGKYLSKEEKQKGLWYLRNNYCSKFLISYKEKIKNKVYVKYWELKDEK